MNKLNNTTNTFNDCNLFEFVLREKWITITVLGSIFTFSFINSLKSEIIDPLAYFIMPEEIFEFMNLDIRENGDRSITVKIGAFLRALVTWLFLMCVLYLLCFYTNFPDIAEGNIKGAAIV